MFNEKCLNKSTRELIINLSFLYEIDPIAMADIIRASLTEKGNIDKEELRKNTRKFYQFNNDNRLPSLLLLVLSTKSINTLITAGLSFKS